MIEALNNIMLQLIYKKLPLNIYSINNNLKQKKKNWLGTQYVCNILNVSELNCSTSTLSLKNVANCFWKAAMEWIEISSSLILGKNSSFLRVWSTEQILSWNKKSELSKTECSKTNIMWRDLAQPFIAKQGRCFNVKANQVSEI